MVDQYLTIGQVAKKLGISVDTVRRWEKAGKLRAYRLDGKNRSFLLRDVDARWLGPSVSVTKAAKYLGISQSTLRRKASKGEIPVTKSSNKFRRFAFADLELLENQILGYRRACRSFFRLYRQLCDFRTE